MFLKNYTSECPVHITISRIEQALIKCGISGITKEYGPSGEIVALTFHIQIQGMPRVTIRLPADTKAATQALWLNYADGSRLTSDGQAIAFGGRKTKRRADFAQQGERTAWKLMQDWVEVQMSLIQMKQADFIQVFLPYVWDESKRQSYYDAIKGAGYRALLPERTDQ